jgi:ferritin-like metal-binding protein YciE
MSSMDSLSDLLQDELKDIYDAEKQLTKALPKLAKKASNEELRDALQSHLQETEGHIERLEQIFEQLGMPARGKKCEGMQHLIAEGNEMIGEAEEDGTRDAVMQVRHRRDPRGDARGGKSRRREADRDRGKLRQRAGCPRR